MVKSAVRVLEILEYFAKRQAGARLSDVALALGYPTSSAEALLKTLAKQGYMHFDAATRRYTPSARLAQLASWIAADGFEQAVVTPALYALRDDLSEPVVAATVNGLHLEYTASVLVGVEQPLYIHAGEKRLLVQTGTGWLFLARQDRTAAIDIYRQTIQAGLLRAADFDETAFLRRLDDHQHTDISVLAASELKAPTGHWSGGMISAILPTPVDCRPLAIGVYGEARALDKKRHPIMTRMRAIIHDVGEKASADRWGARTGE